jgi:hypothetical protein
MKKIIISLVIMAFLALTVSPVLAEGLIRISPHGSYYGEPVMLTSPATFNVYIQSGPDATDPHIFLVMTEACYNGLTDDVEVNWTKNDVITITAWNKETDNSVKVPPGTTNGVGYTVASLKDHLGTTEPIYWAFAAFLDGPITETPVPFTVTLPSTDARMLVYALGRSSDSLFDNRVPPTQPGFVVPELIPILLMLASFVAFALYAVRRRKS